MRLDRKARRPRISGNIRGRSNEARQDAAPAECRHHFHHGLLALGLLVLGGAWFGPLPALASRAFSAHMTLHMAVVAVAAPLLAFGVSGSRLDPARRAPAIFAAVPASILELIVVWAWHTPLLHHLARGRAGMFVLEQATFLAAGLLL